MRRCLGPALGLLLLLLGLHQRASGEWVEIPQFSDRDKVYKLPGLTFPQRQPDNRRVFNAQQSDQQAIAFQSGDPSLRNVSTYQIIRQPSVTLEPLFEATVSTITTERTISTVDLEDEEAAGVEVLDDQASQFDKPSAGHSIEDETSTPTSEAPERHNDTDHKSFLDYLPVELLKRVHKTLKSQPATIKGKIRFLKVFERTLLQEIQSRLSLALAPTRSPRGARDEWHDESIGFPSLEGTLMAISFLTFAVYLVRLVMLLFRNGSNNMGQSLVIGRKRRSIDDYSEETARILSYLEPDSLEL